MHRGVLTTKGHRGEHLSTERVTAANEAWCARDDEIRERKLMGQRHRHVISHERFDLCARDDQLSRHVVRREEATFHDPPEEIARA